MMNRLLKSFLHDEQGQDLIEYALLLAFVSISSAALFITAGGSISDIWNATGSTLNEANSKVAPPGSPTDHYRKYH